MSAMTVVVRAAGDLRALQTAVRGVVQSLDKNAPVYGVRTVEELLDRSVATPRFNTLLLGLFAAVALILTTVGLYGVISCSVSENTQQIGIRVALGAQRSDVLKLIVGQGVTLTIAGVVIGLCRGLRSDAIDVEPAVRRGVDRPLDVHGCRGSPALRGGDRVLPAGTARDERRSHGGAQARLAAPVSHGRQLHVVPTSPRASNLKAIACALRPFHFRITPGLARVGRGAGQAPDVALHGRCVRTIVPSSRSSKAPSRECVRRSAVIRAAARLRSHPPQPIRSRFHRTRRTLRLT